MNPDERALFQQILQLVENAFGPTATERAIEYVTKKRVASVRSMEDQGYVEVQGQVASPRLKTYFTRALLDLNEADDVFVVDSECSCPVGMDCKHAAALTIVYLQQSFREIAWLHDSRDNELSSASAAWLAQLSALPLAPAVADAQPESTTATIRRPCLIYLLALSPRTSLQVMRSQPLKRGGMAKPQPFRLPPGELNSVWRRDYVQADDETALRLIYALMADNYLSPDVRLQGETGRMTLEAAARTGRLYMDGDLTHPLRWSDEARECTFHWPSDQLGRQHLQMSLPLPLLHVPLWPPVYLDPHRHELGALASALPPPLLKVLLEAPPLNDHEATVARAQLKTLSEQLDVSLPLPASLETLSPAQPPTARLRLTLGRFRHSGLLGIVEEYPSAVLHFEYGTALSVVDTVRRDTFVKIDRDGQRQLLQRDTVTEQSYRTRIAQVGLASFTERLPGYIAIDEETDFLLASPSDARGWMPLIEYGLASIEGDDLVVEFDDDFPFRLAAADDWFVQIDEDQGDDWFDLDLGVIIDGERISLVPALMNLLRQQRDILSRLEGMPDDASVPLRIDHRRLLPVPADRLRTWLGPLAELVEGDRPRLSRYHAGALGALADQPGQWQGGERLRELAARLRDFSGITPAPPHPLLNAQLRPYQQRGLDWLQFLREYELGGILADDMGLGKTVQTLAHLQIEKHSGRAQHPSLVISPTSLLPNWCSEAERFTPDLKVLRLHGAERGRLFDALAEADVIFTTYPLIVRDRELLAQHEFHLLVLDEAQFIKNPKAQSFQVVRQLRARHRVSLTGTPLENHLGELWAQFDFLMPGLLGNQRHFNERFRHPVERNADAQARQRLAARVSPFMLRRTKEQVLTDLPPCTEVVRWVELSGAQRDLYEALRVMFDRKLRELLAEQGIARSQISILDALLKLRQACCDPRLVKTESARRLTRGGIRNSAKLQECLSLIEELLSEDRRVLVFSQFTSMLSLIEAELEKRDYRYVKLTGQTRDRETPVSRFQNGEVPLFLISLKAGGTGLNLTTADTVILYDPWWNPAVEEQATARAHRIGQDRPVFVYKLLGRGTVEEKILSLQERKRGLSDSLVTQNGDGQSGAQITAADLEVLFEPIT